MPQQMWRWQERHSLQNLPATRARRRTDPVPHAPRGFESGWPPSTLPASQRGACRNGWRPAERWFHGTSS
eukprot:12882554-Prorocentrum_lima.AAC.1